MIHEILCITYSRSESIHGVYLFSSMQPIAKKAKMNRYTIHESQYRLSTSFAYPTSKPCTAELTEVVFNVEGIQNHFVWGKKGGLVFLLSVFVVN